MPHSESQLFSGLVKETISSVARPQLTQNKNNDNKAGSENINRSVRPPLPPKLLSNGKPPKPKITKKIPSQVESSNQTIQSVSTSIKLSPRLSLPRSRTPTNIDVNNNNSFLSLSRNSSLQSIDSLSSFRSISPSLSLNSSTGSITSTNSRQLRSLTPRRIFPQTYTPRKTIDLAELKTLDTASTVFDGKISFVLGCKNQRIRQEFRSSPAHLSETETASRYLSDKIRDFLKRTDHVTEEWNNHCKTVSNSRKSCDMISFIEEQRNQIDDPRLARSKSVTNIMIKGYQMMKNLPPTERSNSVCRERCGSVISVFSQRTRDDDEETIVDDEVNTHICHTFHAYLIQMNCKMSTFYWPLTAGRTTHFILSNSSKTTFEKILAQSQ